MRDENSNVQLRDFARLAMDALVPDLRMAGFGFPPGDSVKGRPAQALTTASATTFTYGANTDGVTTYANADSTLDTNNWIWAIDPVAAGFAANDHVVFFNANDPNEWNSWTVNFVDTDLLAWPATQTNGFDIQPVTNGVPTVINKYHIISINYNAGTQIITIADDNGTNDLGADDTTITVANNVSDLTFSYFDADGTPLATPMNFGDLDLGDIRRVQISITVVDPDDSDMTVLLETNIHLRNMGT